MDNMDEALRKPKSTDSPNRPRPSRRDFLATAGAASGAFAAGIPPLAPPAQAQRKTERLRQTPRVRLADLEKMMRDDAAGSHSEQFAAYVGNEREGALIFDPHDVDRDARTLTGREIRVNFGELTVDAIGKPGDVYLLHTHHSEMLDDIVARYQQRLPEGERGHTVAPAEREIFGCPSTTDMKTASYEMLGRFLEMNRSPKRIINRVVTERGTWTFNRIEGHQFVQAHSEALRRTLEVVEAALRPKARELQAAFHKNDPEGMGWKRLARTPEESARLAAHLRIEGTYSTLYEVYRIADDALPREAKDAIRRFEDTYTFEPYRKYQDVVTNERQRVVRGQTTFAESLAAIQAAARDNYGIELTYSSVQ